MMCTHRMLISPCCCNRSLKFKLKLLFIRMFQESKIPLLCKSICLIITEKELHAHIDKNSILEKENERVKRELSSVTELHRKVIIGFVNVHLSNLVVFMFEKLAVVVFIMIKYLSQLGSHKVN